jgi:hypothetical protein
MCYILNLGLQYLGTLFFSYFFQSPFEFSDRTKYCVVGVFSRQFWHQLLRRFGLPDVAPQPSTVGFFDWWQQAGNAFNKVVGRGFNSLVMLGAWILWNERNDIVFNGVSPRLERALLLARDEADHWMLAGAKSLVAASHGG